MEAETTESAFASVLNVCGVCKENLHGREPKLLSCLHVFCKQCVLNLVESKHDFHTQDKTCLDCQVLTVPHYLVSLSERLTKPTTCTVVCISLVRHIS